MERLLVQALLPEFLSYSLSKEIIIKHNVYLKQLVPARRLRSLGLNSLETRWNGGASTTSGWVGSSRTRLDKPPDAVHVSEECLGVELGATS